MVSHGGEWAGYRSDMIRFPEQRISVICLANCDDMNPTGLAKKVADLYLADESGEHRDVADDHDEVESIELPVAEMKGKVGFYRNQKTGIIWELSLDDGKLFAEVSGMRFQLIPTSPAVFEAVDLSYSAIVEFEPQSDTGPMQMQVSVEGRDPDNLCRIKADEISGDEQQEYAGVYDCEELGVPYKLIFRDDRLTLSRKGAPEETIKPINKDLFKGSHVSLEFIRDEGKAIVGFALGAGRVKNLRFDRERSA